MLLVTKLLIIGNIGNMEIERRKFGGSDSVSVASPEPVKTWLVSLTNYSFKAFLKCVQQFYENVRGVEASIYKH